jgi:hypothetical protein
MTQYFISMYQPDGGPPPQLDMDRVMRDLGAIRDELKASGSWVFAGGLRDSDTATVVRVKDGDTLTTDGPYIEGKEHIGGFNVVNLPDLDAALDVARRMSEATGLPIEVRPFHEAPADS